MIHGLYTIHQIVSELRARCTDIQVERSNISSSAEAFERITSFMATKAPKTKWDFIEALKDFTEGQPSYMRDSMESFIGDYLSVA